MATITIRGEVEIQLNAEELSLIYAATGAQSSGTIRTADISPVIKSLPLRAAKSNSPPIQQPAVQAAGHDEEERDWDVIEVAGE